MFARLVLQRQMHESQIRPWFPCDVRHQHRNQIRFNVCGILCHGSCVVYVLTYLSEIARAFKTRSRFQEGRTAEAIGAISRGTEQGSTDELHAVQCFESLGKSCDDVGGSAKALCQAGSIQRTKLNMTGRQRQVSNLAVPPPRNLLADLHAKLAKA